MLVLEVAKFVITALIIAYVVASLADYDEKQDGRCEYDPNSQDCRTCPFPCDGRDKAKEGTYYEQINHTNRRE